ncbi:MAG TPA: hypothetical protein VME47_19965 [Acetobacteraceae bacterium]|nr:hypothetical protein [Acetobacteraceae bacterium]
MCRFVLPIMVVGAVLLMGSATSFAAATDRFVQATVTQTAIQPADYVWNHHHYKHRSWDKEHKRWHYY